MQQGLSLLTAAGPIAPPKADHCGDDSGEEPGMHHTGVNIAQIVLGLYTWKTLWILLVTD
jgi:hypothetical protein